MKKLLALILCIALALFAFASCDPSTGGDENLQETLNGKTPDELYEISQTKLKEATSFYVKSTQDIVMYATNGEQTQTFTITQLVESKVDGDNSYVKTSNNMDDSLNMEAWYVDGVVYGNTAGQKIKVNITKQEYMEQYMGTDPSESTLLDIPESWFENVKFENEDGVWALNFIVSGEKYTEYYENIGLAGEINGDITYKIIFDEDGNMQKITTSFDMTISGVSAHCDSVSIVTIGDVEVTPPADADSYIPVSIN